MNKIVFLSILMVSGLTQANIGGVNYNIGSYDCVDRDQQGVEASFTFGNRNQSTVANVNIKGEEVSMECSKTRQAAPQNVNLFKKTYTEISDICVGQAAKGEVVIGMSNSMGIVQVTAFLLDNGGNVKANALLNCKSAAPKKNGGGW